MGRGGGGSAGGGVGLYLTLGRSGVSGQCKLVGCVVIGWIGVRGGRGAARVRLASGGGARGVRRAGTPARGESGGHRLKQFDESGKC